MCTNCISFRIVYRCILALTIVSLAACSVLGPSRQHEEPSSPVSPAASEQHVVFLLPNEGVYTPISQKILSGARLAVSELKQKGSTMVIKVIYTKGNWLQELAALPPQYNIIAGPVQEKVYQQVRRAGLTEKRTFFTFLGKLEPGDEGVRAWRFFTSAEDQADAIVKFVSSDLGITTVGALYPSDSYSLHMTNLVEQKFAAKNVILQRAAYRAEDPSSMQSAVNSLLGMQSDEATGKPVPHPSCEALFLPISWKQFSPISAQFSSHGVKSLAMLGTILWDSNLNGRSTPNAAQYPLVAFPSAFVKEMAPQPLSSGLYDMWAALGYDFVRFANRLNLDRRLPAQQLNARIKQAAMMNYAIAPMSYDSSGCAHQKLFMLQPGVQGAVLMQKSSFQSMRMSLKQHHDSEGATGASSEKGTVSGVEEPTQPSLPQTAQKTDPPEQTATSSGRSDVSTSQPVLSTHPRTSYKLSLPDAR